jgi:hypothetical protein
MVRDRVHRIVKVVIIGVLAVGVFGLLVMALWNWLMPSLFGLARIGFWQALGLFLLSKLLFCGFQGGHSRHPRDWRRRMAERWARMTPEQREKFRQGLRENLREHWFPPEPVAEEGPSS